MATTRNRTRRWILREAPGAEPSCPVVRELHPVLRRLLGQRGYVEEGLVADFLEPRLRDLSDPFDLPEMELAVARIFQAVDAGEKICVYGDYDVDGISSITLMETVLQAYGAEVRHFVPVRSSEGYGLSEAAIARCMAEGPQPDLFVTVDCGTVSHEPIGQLRGQGIDVIVVDHHERGEAGRPPCVALINPKFEETPYSYLCAAGVVFKLAHALLKTRPLPDFDLRNVLDLVAVATIADIVPLVGENRLLVRHGLRRLPKTMNAGLRALMGVTGLNGHASSSDVGFRIGPRINAAGRMDRPDEALSTLLAESPASAKELAERLDSYNRERQKMELRILAEAEAQLAETHDVEDEPVIVVGSRAWHPGVVGIVASRLMRKYHRPCFVVAIDEEGVGKGSGRSVEGVSLVEAIRNGEEFLITGGGHHMAAGISVHEEQLENFRHSFSEFVARTARPEDLEPKLSIDGELDLGDLDLDFLHQYERLQPFGSGNPVPVFVARNVWLSEEPRVLKNNHLKLWLRQGGAEKDAMFFGGGERDLPEPPWDVAFTIDRNCFRGVTSCQMLVRDIRPAGEL
ncbi:single-stranded-DNA-specific exonuclease RecJ [Roseibacillus ishigakijimensis]|uniref:Single-stranded-DNA-specific exonuclease RecJ n=1 Tax=Roseibacillus ishigakijimensis TaxID=454146 RepID=A0A934VM11_9BACT|nr:single-stranded-DNA-specific exonuclease RecJ [Roseibacillus ishigakijimensis]MBK1835249.1 single-stranded-DNA-specific exonuclease RecJ [Roseibacillus ishigakijimensis]